MVLYLGNKNIELNSIGEFLILEDRIRKNVGRIDIEDDVCEQMEQILQKISEVENA